MPRRKKETRPAIRWGDGSIQERITKDGARRYQARWYEVAPDGRQVRRSRTVATMEEAEAILRGIGADKRSGRFQPESRMTVTEAVEEYAARKTRSGDWRPNTVGTNRGIIESHIAPTIGHQLVTRITHRQIQLWIDGMLDRKLSVSFTANALSLVRGALADLQRLGVIGTNPALGVTVGKRGPGRTATWTLEQVQQLLRTAEPDPHLYARYLLALETGMRPGELRALRWADIDLDEGVLRCQHTMTRDERHVQVIGTTTKTGRTRIIALSRAAVDALRRWRTKQKEHQLAAVTWHPDDIVFDRGDGRFLPDSTFQDQHRRLVALAGIPPLNPHGMRHTYATLELEAGTNPGIVRERVGHATVAMTLDRYSHVSRALQQRAAEDISRRLLCSDATTSGPEDPNSEQTDASMDAREQ